MDYITYTEKAEKLNDGSLYIIVRSNYSVHQPTYLPTYLPTPPPLPHPHLALPRLLRVSDAYTLGPFPSTTTTDLGQKFRFQLTCIGEWVDGRVVEVEATGSYLPACYHLPQTLLGNRLSWLVWLNRFSCTGWRNLWPPQSNPP